MLGVMKRKPKRAPSAAKTAESPQRRNLVGLVLVGLFVTFCLYLIFVERTPLNQGQSATTASGATGLQLGTPAPGTPGGAPARTGTPWEHDETTNHHWDPRPGHQHWHQGPPPPDLVAAWRGESGQTP